ncbi:hypothetical protein AAG906_023418 [Vitis piasezkii]
MGQDEGEEKRFFSYGIKRAKFAKTFKNNKLESNGFCQPCLPTQATGAGTLPGWHHPYIGMKEF